MLSDNLDEILPLVSTGKNQKSKKSNTTAPTTLSTYKNDISRRVISVPNPESFLRLAKYINENWDQVKSFSASNNSLSPITFIKSYSRGVNEFINCESIREVLKARSDFINGLKQCIRVSLGYKYRLKIDIKNCYNSMYTHSISWAVCGKEAAKLYFRTHQPESLEEIYEISDRLDCFIRQQKNNETNGIIVGPYTSRIISEIILSRIDKMLTEKGFVFKRYVDDYKMYFRTEAQAQESIPIIEKVLNEFNLSLNTSKTEVEKFPYEIISQIKNKYKEAFDENGVFGVLNAASQLYVSGEKGAYKYALKYLRDKNSLKQDFQIIIPTLINIMLLDPRYGKYVTQYLKKHIPINSLDVLSKVLNKELASSLQNELQQESLLFLQMIRDLNLKITANNIINTIKSNNDFSIIIALDIWKNRKDMVERNKSEAQKINIAIRQLLNNLEGEKISGPRWLLLYELHANNLISKKNLPAIDFNEFFQKILSMKITFYKGVKQSS